VHRTEIFEELPYSPRIRAMADLVETLPKPEQDRVFRVVNEVAKPAGDGTTVAEEPLAGPEPKAEAS
jgi:hypothetical protein